VRLRGGKLRVREREREGDKDSNCEGGEREGRWKSGEEREVDKDISTITWRYQGERGRGGGRERVRQGHINDNMGKPRCVRILKLT